MKCISIVYAFVLALLFSGVSAAALFLVCDPNPASEGVTHYALQFQGEPELLVAADPTREYGFKFDSATQPMGTRTLSIKAVRVDPAWGRVDSVSVPFEFSRPGEPQATTGARLVPD